MTKEEASLLAKEIEDIIERLKSAHERSIGDSVHTDIVCAQTALKHGLSMIKNKE